MRLTLADIERIRQMAIKHGRYSAAAKAERLYLRQLLKQCRKTSASIDM
jgi:hypothetical protein